MATLEIGAWGALVQGFIYLGELWVADTAVFGISDSEGNTMVDNYDLTTGTPNTLQPNVSQIDNGNDNFQVMVGQMYDHPITVTAMIVTTIGSPPVTPEGTLRLRLIYFDATMATDASFA